MADFGTHGHVIAACNCSLQLQLALALTMTHKPLLGVLAVSEHMGQGQAMPQQGIVQNAEKNAGKGDQDQADLEASTEQNPAEHNLSKGAHKTVPHKPFSEMNIKKLTRAEKGELVDRVLQVIYRIVSRIC